MLSSLTTRSNALSESVDRGYAILNCYDQLLRVIPNAKDTAVMQDRKNLMAELNDWVGHWTVYEDYQDHVVPYETSFVAHRAFYASRIKFPNLDLSAVPYVVQHEDKLDKPEILSWAEMSERLKSPMPQTAPATPDVPPVVSRSSNTGLWMLIGAGAAAIVYLVSRGRKMKPAYKFAGLSGTTDEHAQQIEKLLTIAGWRINDAQIYPASREYLLRIARDYLMQAESEHVWLPRLEKQEFIKRTEDLWQYLYKTLDNK